MRQGYSGGFDLRNIFLWKLKQIIQGHKAIQWLLALKWRQEMKNLPTFIGLKYKEYMFVRALVPENDILHTFSAYRTKVTQEVPFFTMVGPNGNQTQYTGNIYAKLYPMSSQGPQGHVLKEQYKNGIALRCPGRHVRELSKCEIYSIHSQGWRVSDECWNNKGSGVRGGIMRISPGNPLQHSITKIVSDLRSNIDAN